jgi:hypothetical protein
MDKQQWLDSLTLDRGAHSPNGEFCVMEAVARWEGAPWSDRPESASPVISAFLRRWNDALDLEDRQALKVFIPLLGGSRGTPEVELRRGYMAADWAVREMAPLWLDAAGLGEQAAALRGLAPVADEGSARAAGDAAGDAGDAAWDAAGDAEAAARAAARAAGDAAWAAAGAAWAAAGAAWAAAGAAARAAAGRAVEGEVQASALSLVHRLLAVG